MKSEMGFDPTKILLNFESDLDHRLDRKNIKYLDFVIYLLSSHFALEKRDMLLCTL